MTPFGTSGADHVSDIVRDSMLVTCGGSTDTGPIVREERYLGTQ